MTRSRFVFGALAAAALLAHAEPDSPPAAPKQDSTSDRFAGELGYRTDDGEWVPVLPDAVFVGWGEGGCEIEAQTSERLAVYPDGKFTLQTLGQVQTIKVVRIGPDGSVRETLPAVTMWPCYRFRVKGCDDAVVQFGPKPPRATIEMTCPGRGAHASRDG